jgi:hypothetical protein
MVFVALAVLSTFFYARVREEDALLDGFAKAATRGVASADTEAVALALSRAVFLRVSGRVRPENLPLYERLESSSFFNMTSAVCLRHGAYGLVGQPHLGPCGAMTRVTLRALDRLGIASRKLHLLDDPSPEEFGHTMVEFRSGGRWLVLSPSDSSFVWRGRDGEVATLAEIQADSSIFAQIFARYPGYPYRVGHTGHVRWEKLPRVARTAVRAVLGEARYENALTPKLYDDPRRLFLLASLVALGCCALGAVLVWTPWRRARGARNPDALDSQ